MLRPRRILGGEEDAHKTIKTVFFVKKSNQVEQDHHEEIGKTPS